LESSRGPARGERLRLTGPAGELEALLEMPTATPPLAVGVICHPHPLFGGTLENKVVYTLARSFQELGAATLRFNFRGVGASGGQFGEGLGETDDTLAVIAALRARLPDLPLWLAGFSFGGAVAVRAAGNAAPRQLVTVAPAVTRMNLNDIKVPDCPWLIVQGRDDELVAASAVQAWATRLNPQPTLKLLAGVGHFFHGRLRELSQVVVDFAHERGIVRESEKPG
jgi:alpha/beta superfamily hydrolase